VDAAHRLLAALRAANKSTNHRLQIEPEFRRGPEPVAKAQGGVAGEGLLAVDDLRDPVGRHVDLARQFGGRLPRSGRASENARIRRMGLDPSLRAPTTIAGRM